MRKLHLNDVFLLLLGPIISRFLACSNEKKNKPMQQRVHALVLSLWFKPTVFVQHFLLCFVCSLDVIQSAKNPHKRLSTKRSSLLKVGADLKTKSIKCI